MGPRVLGTAEVRRIGLIVPSSNTTMEEELPALLGRAKGAGQFTFHSSRMRMRNVNSEELAAMNAQTERAAGELADLAPNVVATACLVAIMAQGPDQHRVVEDQISRVLAAFGSSAPVVSSAGALIQALRELGAKRIAMVTPYEKPLTRLVVRYLEASGIAVQDTLSLEMPDNRAVAALDPLELRQHWQKLDLRGCDALVLSACVQMRSCESIEAVEQASGLPTLSASTATCWAILRALGLPTLVPGAGALLAGSPAPD